MDGKRYKDVNRLRNGYITQVLSVDIDEIVKMGGKMCNIYEGAIYEENLNVSPFRKDIEHLYNLNLKYEEGNDFMVDLIKWSMNSLYEQSIRKDIDEEYILRSENWLVKNNDGRVVDYEPLPNGDFVIKYKIDPGIDKIKEVEKIMPSHLGVFLLSQSKRIMNKFDHEIDGFCSNKVNYQDTDSLYIHMDHFEKLKEAGYVGKNLGQGKKDCGDGGVFYGLLLVRKMILCYTKDKHGTLGEKLTFKGFHDTKRLLNTDKYFKLRDGETVNEEFPLPWKRSFAHGITIDKKETTNKDFKSNLN